MVDILLAEDEPTLARNVARFLRRRGYSVSVAATLAEARDLCRRMLPRILVTDYNLPDGVGLLLVDELRRDGSPCKIVVITAEEEEGLADDAIRRGAQRFMQKPVPFAELEAVVGEFARAA